MIDQFQYIKILTMALRLRGIKQKFLKRNYMEVEG